MRTTRRASTSHSRRLPYGVCIGIRKVGAHGALMLSVMAVLVAFTQNAFTQNAFAQSFSGRWMIDDGALRAVLELNQDGSHVTGEIDIAGTVTELDGNVQGPRVVIDKLDGVPIVAGDMIITADKDAMIVDIRRPGSDPVHWRMTPLALALPSPKRVTPVSGRVQRCNTSAATCRHCRKGPLRVLFCFDDSL